MSVSETSETSTTDTLNPSRPQNAELEHIDRLVTLVKTKRHAGFARHLVNAHGSKRKPSLRPKLNYEKTDSERGKESLASTADEGQLRRRSSESERQCLFLFLFTS